MSGDGMSATARELRTAASAAVAGIIFAVTLSTAVLLLRHAAPDGIVNSTGWVADPTQRRALSWALDLIPYAGIAFLWFIGVLRTRLGAREDRLFATVLLGSGLLFVATLFVSVAVIGGLLVMLDGTSPVPEASVALATSITFVLLGTVGLRMAAVFTLVVTNLGRRTAILPRWLYVVGYLVGAVLLLTPPRSLWAAIIFPAWVLLLSINILVSWLRSRHDHAALDVVPDEAVSE